MPFVFNHAMPVPLWWSSEDVKLKIKFWQSKNLFFFLYYIKKHKAKITNEPKQERPGQDRARPKQKAHETKAQRSL